MSGLVLEPTTLYYNLVWLSMKDYKVWISNKQELDGEYYSGKVRLRKSNILLKLYGNINPVSNELFTENITNIKLFHNVPLIKSNLQKCIRRGLIDEALVTAHNFIVIKPWDFLRRILIIMVEDVSITDNMDLIMWLMVGFPNYRWTNEITRYLLLTVYSLCISKKTIPIQKSEIVDIPENRYINAIYSNILRPLLIRYEYGGLKGDMCMLKNLLLDGRNFNNSIIKVSKQKLILSRNIKSKDIIKPSIDFHITAKMIDFIAAKSTFSDKELIKKIIWYNSSGINYRKPDIIFEQEKYRVILPFMNEFYKLYKIW
uniref:Uncharacterized protein n=1 Tax=viral metagenome TaxID=1070528 RepID=A0A6C0B469_9ZZZZ